MISKSARAGSETGARASAFITGHPRFSMCVVINLLADHGLVFVAEDCRRKFCFLGANRQS